MSYIFAVLYHELQLAHSDGSLGCWNNRGECQSDVLVDDVPISLANTNDFSNEYIDTISLHYCDNFSDYIANSVKYRDAVAKSIANALATW